MFIGREKELKNLNNLYNRDSFEFAVIYGRRRVGKTTLINEFVKGKETIFYSGIDSNEAQNLELLSRAIMSADKGSDSEVSFKSFEAALDHIYQMAGKERIVLVIDEFPYLANCYPGISSLLAAYIDHKFQSSRLMLILCGSSLSFMENQVLGYQSPLYGRRTSQMRILPFTFAECAQYYKSFDIQELALAYGVSGGIPLYLSKLDDKKSMAQNIKENFFNMAAYLFEEPGNLIKQECREPMQYNAIIKAIATGASRLHEIGTSAGISETGATTTYISRLTSLGIVEKEYPFKTESSRKTIYRLSDGMFQFWYRFVPSNWLLISQGEADMAYERIEEKIPAYMGFVFEKICKEYLWRENIKQKLPIFFTDIGRWWGNDHTAHKQTEIDIMADNDDNEAIFAECKWRNELTGEAELKQLKHQSELFNYKKTILFLFSKSGFTKGCTELAKTLGNVKLITLDDMKWI